MIEEMLRFITQTTPDDPRLPATPTELGFLPGEGFTKLLIPVSDLPEADISQIHRARCPGTKAFHNGGARNDWGWVETGGKQSYGDLREQAVPRLLVLFKIRNVVTEDRGVHRLALVSVLEPINGGRFFLARGHIRVGKRSTD